MSNKLPPNQTLVLSYMGLRKVIGVVAVGLPFVLAIGHVLWQQQWGLKDSISSYYYTEMRDVLVGSLCAIAVFLMSYRGYDRRDDIAGNIACVFALGVAFFPGVPDASPTEAEKMIGHIHLASATGFFLTLSYFALVLFRKTDPAKPLTDRKRYRNRVYTVCGYAMLACMVVLAATRFLPHDSAYRALDPVFWFEALAIVAFGVSWFTKGEGILSDDET